MEEKLAEYRARRRRAELVDKTKDTFNSMIGLVTRNNEQTTNDTEPQDDPAEPSSSSAPLLPPSSPDISKKVTGRERLLWWLNILLVALLWLTLLVLSIHFEFGLAYALISALAFVCTNTRTRARAPGEPSAYSVFNPNCEAIDGTLKAEQFEQELRYGPASVR